MQNHRAPLILEGQVYYDTEKNAYLVVIKKNGDVVTYRGQAFNQVLGFRGMLEDEEFAVTFQPVDPVDLTQSEKDELTSYCAPGTKLKLGFIKEED